MAKKSTLEGAQNSVKKRQETAKNNWMNAAEALAKKIRNESPELSQDDLAESIIFKWTLNYKLPKHARVKQFISELENSNSASESRAAGRQKTEESGVEPDPNVCRVGVRLELGGLDMTRETRRSGRSLDAILRTPIQCPPDPPSPHRLGAHTRHVMGPSVFFAVVSTRPADLATNASHEWMFGRQGRGKRRDLPCGVRAAGVGTS